MGRAGHGRNVFGEFFVEAGNGGVAFIPFVAAVGAVADEAGARAWEGPGQGTGHFAHGSSGVCRGADAARAGWGGVER